MLKYFSICSLVFLIACSNELKVVEKGQTLVTIDKFPAKDTMIMVKDYFITYKKEGMYILGSVESPFSEGNGQFKSSKSVTIDISDNKFSIY